MVANAKRCRICRDVYLEEQYPICSECGCFLVELEELDLSPNAPLDVIFKKVNDC